MQQQLLLPPLPLLPLPLLPLPLPLPLPPLPLPLPRLAPAAPCTAHWSCPATRQ